MLLNADKPIDGLGTRLPCHVQSYARRRIALTVVEAEDPGVWAFPVGLEHQVPSVAVEPVTEEDF
jgi:hypothetical protein